MTFLATSRCRAADSVGRPPGIVVGHLDEFSPAACIHLVSRNYDVRCVRLLSTGTDGIVVQLRGTVFQTFPAVYLGGTVRAVILARMA